MEPGGKLTVTKCLSKHWTGTGAEGKALAGGWQRRSYLSSSSSWLEKRCDEKCSVVENVQLLSEVLGVLTSSVRFVFLLGDVEIDCSGSESN